MSIPPEKRQWLCVIPDQPDKLAKRLEIRQTHLANLKSLLEADRVVIGGPSFKEAHPTEGEAPQFNGSVMILRGSSAEEIREIISGDIYASSGVWDLEKMQIIPVAMIA